MNNYWLNKKHLKIASVEIDGCAASKIRITTSLGTKFYCRVFNGALFTGLVSPFRGDFLVSEQEFEFVENYARKIFGSQLSNQLDIRMENPCLPNQNEK